MENRAQLYDWGDKGFCVLLSDTDSGRISRRIERHEAASSRPAGWYYSWQWTDKAHEGCRGPYKTIAELISDEELLDVIWIELCKAVSR